MEYATPPSPPHGLGDSTGRVQQLCCNYGKNLEQDERQIMNNRLLVTGLQLESLDLALVISGGVYKTSSKDCVFDARNWCWRDIYQSMRYSAQGEGSRGECLR